jgi:lipopolysaccharide/colanic/teichoic acid biosynthesis glycosyltransferase
VLRLFDIFLSLFGLIILSPLLLLVFLISLVFQPGSPLFRQQRVGREQKLFTLTKFRTMKPETDSVGTHEVNPSQVTAWGKLLRKTKIDELPQLWNVLLGDMSLVGPRPCLPNQTELIQARARLGVFGVRPGITGLAQIQGIDMSTPDLLAQTDAEMIRTMGVAVYFKYILRTICGSGFGDRVGSSSEMGDRR